MTMLRVSILSILVFLLVKYYVQLIEILPQEPWPSVIREALLDHHDYHLEFLE